MPGSHLASTCTLQAHNSLGASVGDSDAGVDAAQCALVFATVEDEKPEVRDLVDQHGDSQGHIHLQQQRQTPEARQAEQGLYSAVGNNTPHNPVRGDVCSVGVYDQG